MVQMQRNILFRSFGVWHSKTNVCTLSLWFTYHAHSIPQSLPAIRFEASHIKAKLWSRWRNNMPHTALVAKAKDKERKTLLGEPACKIMYTTLTVS
jgi:protein SFI1